MARNESAYRRLDQMALHRIFQMREWRAERSRTCKHEYEPIEGRAHSWCLRCVHCATVVSLLPKTVDNGLQAEQRRLL